ncbi:MAG: double-stranded DNA-binding protein [Candidatus Bathyarchaeota archaeon]|nr:double-stranded DNA-binding protein [Candidatus Bathyarchaeota archaeon]
MSDTELEVLKLKKLKELQRRIVSQKSQQTKEEPLKIVEGVLVGRGKEVLKAAYSQFPDATRMIVEYLAKLIKEGKLSGELTGEELYAIFRSLGLNVKLETKIVFKEHGKAKSLIEKLKEG